MVRTVSKKKGKGKRGSAAGHSAQSEGNDVSSCGLIEWRMLSPAWEGREHAVTCSSGPEHVWESTGSQDDAAPDGVGDISSGDFEAHAAADGHLEEARWMSQPHRCAMEESVRAVMHELAYGREGFGGAVEGSDDVEGVVRSVCAGRDSTWDNEVLQRIMAEIAKEGFAVSKAARFPESSPPN